MMEGKRPYVRTLIAVAVLVLAAAPASAAEDTTGKVTIETMSVGAGLGVSWGDGVLEYRGEKYPFTLTGFSIGDVGVSKVVAKGMVFNLKSVEDFSGLFMAALAGGTMGGGASAGATHNQNNVSMVWTGTNQGLSLSLAHSGVRVQLTPEAQLQAAKSRRNASAQGEPAAAPRTSP